MPGFIDPQPARFGILATLRAEREAEQFKYDVYDKILSFMFKEFIINTAFGQATFARLGAAGKRAAFFALVFEDQKWDHKTILRQRFFNNKGPFYTGVRGDNKYVYFYDIWSNMHYGYVGRAIDIGRTELQIAQQIFGGVSDAGDDLSVEIGMDIWDQKGLKITPKTIQNYILDNRSKFVSTGKAKLPSEVHKKTGGLTIEF